MNLAGPQSDRDLHWRKGPSARASAPKEEVRFVLSRCVRLQFTFRSLPLQVFDSENSRLRSENNLLKDQLQRSLKELKQYQQRYPSPYAAQLEADHQQDEGNPSLTASPEITSALLTAYDTSKIRLSSCFFFVRPTYLSTHCHHRDIRAGRDDQAIVGTERFDQGQCKYTIVSHGCSWCSWPIIYCNACCRPRL